MLPNPRRLMVTCCDEKYFDFARIAIWSFLRYNPEWPVVVLSVGLLRQSICELSRRATVIEYPRRMCLGHYPAAFARLMFMAEIHDHQTILYVDSDTVTYGSVASLTDEFEKSDYGISLALDKHDMGEFWLEAPTFLRGYPAWRTKTGLSTGVVLMKSNPCRVIAKEAIGMYDKHSSIFGMAEQTPIVSLIYEHGIPFMEMPNWFHACTWDEKMAGFPEMPRVDGRDVVIAHTPGGSKVSNEELSYLHRRFVPDGRLDMRKHNLLLSKIRGPDLSPRRRQERQ